MRVLQLEAEGVERLHLHPNLTLMLGAGGPARQCLVDALGDIARGRVAGFGGVIESRGLRFALTAQELAELELPGDLDAVVRPWDVPHLHRCTGAASARRRRLELDRDEIRAALGDAWAALEQAREAARAPTVQPPAPTVSGAETEPEVPIPRDEDVAALKSAHVVVLDAQGRAESRLSGPRSRKRLTEARAVERAILEGLGAKSYADYMMALPSRVVAASRQAVPQTTGAHLALAGTPWTTAGSGSVDASVDASPDEQSAVLRLAACENRIDDQVVVPLADHPDPVGDAARDADRASADVDRLAVDLATAEAKLAEAREVDPALPAPASAVDRGVLIDDVEWYLLARLAAQRSVSPAAGSVPLVLDDPFGDLRSDEKVRLLSRIERLSGAVQVIVFTDDSGLVEWVGELPADRAAVVHLSG